MNIMENETIKQIEQKRRKNMQKNTMTFHLSMIVE